MSEAVENVVEIPDFDEETVRGMLEYIYTGETNSIEGNSTNLFQIAEKYELMGLKRKCENIIMNNIKVENAGEILSLADIHSPESLKPRVIRFITRY